MARVNLEAGHEVVVITGPYSGRRGKVLSLPSKGEAIVKLSGPILGSTGPHTLVFTTDYLAVLCS